MVTRGKFCALTEANGWDKQEQMNSRSTTGGQTDGQTDVFFVYILFLTCLF